MIMVTVKDLVEKLTKWQEHLGKIDAEVKRLLEKEATDAKPGQTGNARPLEVFYDGYVQSFLYEVVKGIYDTRHLIQKELGSMDDIKPTSDETGEEKLTAGDISSRRLSSINKEEISADDDLVESLQTALTTCEVVADSVLRKGSAWFDASKIGECLEDVLTEAKKKESEKAGTLVQQSVDAGTTLEKQD